MEIKITHGLDHFEDPFYVRTEVFVKEQKFENEKDDIDDFCTHFTGYIKDIPVASGRCYNQDKNTMAIGRIAVIKEYRSYHLGSAKQSDFTKNVDIIKSEMSTWMNIAHTNKW